MVHVMSVLNKETTESLGEAIPKEQARVREILGFYKEIGTKGLFSATGIEQSLRRCDEAVISGDIVKMLVAYEGLKAIV